MKTILPLVLLFMLLNLQSACTKGDDAQIAIDPVLTSDNSPVSLQNSWELRYVYGGYRAPNSNPNYAPGNKNIWKFHIPLQPRNKTVGFFMNFINKQLNADAQENGGAETAPEVTTATTNAPVAEAAACSCSTAVL
jgi:hypothetical protein